MRKKTSVLSALAMLLSLAGSASASGGITDLDRPTNDIPPYAPIGSSARRLGQFAEMLAEIEVLARGRPSRPRRGRPTSDIFGKRLGLQNEALRRVCQ